MRSHEPFVPRAWHQCWAVRESTLVYGFRLGGLFPLSFLTLGVGLAITLADAPIPLRAGRIARSCDFAGRIKAPFQTDGRAGQSIAVDTCGPLQSGTSRHLMGLTGAPSCRVSPHWLHFGLRLQADPLWKQKHFPRAGGRRNLIMGRSQAACPKIRRRAGGRVSDGRSVGRYTMASPLVGAASPSSGVVSNSRVQAARHGQMPV